jgi:hypothetical protein
MLLYAVLPKEWEEKDEQLVNNEIDDEDKIGTDLYIVAWWLIIKAVNDIGMSIHLQPAMDKDQVFAIF